MEKTASPTSKNGVQHLLASRLGLALAGLVVLAAAYGMLLVSLDTGKLQYYFLMFVLLGFGLNRLARTLKNRHHD